MNEFGLVIVCWVLALFASVGAMAMLIQFTINVVRLVNV
jgi:hypothetical protein